MSSPRHRAREVALQVLYRYDVALQGKNSNPQTIGESKLTLNMPAAKTITPEDLDRAVDRLIAAANEEGGIDNISVVLARVEVA